jgi:hypothetical protein
VPASESHTRYHPSAADEVPKVASGQVTGNQRQTVPTGQTLTIGGITGWVGSVVARARMRPIESVGDERDGEGL